MYRLATCNDLITLKAKYRDAHMPEHIAWGLKEMGRLFCLDEIERSQPQRVLEAGAGCDQFFARRFAHVLDYHMIDRAGFYDRADFEDAMSQRPRTTFIDGLLGDPLPQLVAESFDMVFSISVLEHVDNDQVPAVCREMFRILKPGGSAVHTLDIWPTSPKISMCRVELERAGFEFAEPPGLEFSINGPAVTLFEPLAIKFKYYGGRRSNLWDDVKPIVNQSASILIHARKRLGAEGAG